MKRGGALLNVFSILGLLAALIPTPAAAAAGTSHNSHTGTVMHNQWAPRVAAPVPIPKPLQVDRRFRQSGTVAAPSSGSTVGGPWTQLGPTPVTDSRYVYKTTNSDWGNVGGRVTALVTDPTNSSNVFAGTAGGGVWKSTNAGLNWSPLTDNQSSLAIGALAIDSTGQVIYAGTGEDNRSDSQPGQGILKSTNGGSSWTLVTQTFAGGHIGGLAVDQTTSGTKQHVFAATDIGLYESTNGGSTWTQILSSPTTEVVQDPSSASTFWATLSDYCASSQGLIDVSTDGGKTWSTRLTSSPQATRIGLGIGANGVAYAAFADCHGNLESIQKTTNYGVSGSWSTLWSTGMTPPSGLTNYLNFNPTLPGSTRGQGDYDNLVAVDPSNSNNVIFGGVDILATSNGGSTFTDVGKVYSNGFIHPDFHAAAFIAANTFYVGNDGGVWKTADLGGTGQSSDWTNLNATLAAIQFYAGSALDLTDLLGGAQDNGTSGRLPGAAALPSWQEYLGGDGDYTAIDPTPGSSIIYAEFSSGFPMNIQRGSSILTVSSSSPYDSFTAAGPCILLTDPACSETDGYIAPFVMDPSNPLRLIAGANHIYQTTNGGQLTSTGDTSWTMVGTMDVTKGSSAGDFVTAITEGPTGSTNTIFTGSLLGLVYRTTDAASWTNITGNLPAFSTASSLFPLAWITSIAFNPTNAAEAWVTIGGSNITVNGLSVGQIWHTTNAGATGGTTWTDVSGTIPKNLPLTSVVEDPRSPSTVYIATYNGVMVCTTCGGNSPSPNWATWGSGLPNVWVNALTLTRDNSHVIAWTHGRGAWAQSIQPAGNWTQQNPTGAPSPRMDQSMAYDPQVGNLVLFGGCVPGAPTVDGDTWTWNGTTWTQQNPTSSPSARCESGTAYDGYTQTVVLFGGGNGTTNLNDTWTWNGTNWTQVAPSVSPSARNRPAMAYDDANGTVVLFGGQAAGGTGGTYFNDTWVWDGANWTQKSPANSPSARADAMMVYDPVTAQLVLFGGRNGTLPSSSTTVYGDTWIWNGSNWTQQNPTTSPSARVGSAVNYDDLVGGPLMFGGAAQKCTRTGCQWVYDSDTWTWTGNNWTQETPASSPSARYGARLDYDAVRQKIVLFGGFGASLYGDTWTYS